MAPKELGARGKRFCPRCDMPVRWFPAAAPNDPRWFGFCDAWFAGRADHPCANRVAVWRPRR